MSARLRCVAESAVAITIVVVLLGFGMAVYEVGRLLGFYKGERI